MPATEELRDRDQLFYEATGEEEPAAPDLTDPPGLRLAAATPREIERVGRDRELHEAVVKEGSRLKAPVGDVVLRPGDVLMLDTGAGVREAFEGTDEFFVTTEAGGEEPKGTLEDPAEVRPGELPVHRLHPGRRAPGRGPVDRHRRPGAHRVADVRTGGDPGTSRAVSHGRGRTRPELIGHRRRAHLARCRAATPGRRRSPPCPTAAP